MTNVEVTWLKMKREELKKQWVIFGDQALNFDANMYIKLINELEREIRVLRTRLGRKI